MAKKTKKAVVRKTINIEEVDNGYIVSTDTYGSDAGNYVRQVFRKDEEDLEVIAQLVADYLSSK